MSKRVHTIICPFGIYCKYITHKKYQYNNVCYWFEFGKCTEDKKYYEIKDMEKRNNE